MLKKISSLFLIPVANWYLSKDRNYSFEKISLRIKAGVFHPGLFFSTKILIKWLKNQEIKGKTLLELGAGSGLISFISAKRGAIVTASDISLKVVENLKFNARQNQLHINPVLSDLFDQFPENQYFDFIIINPPYYPKAAQNEDERAWYCGPDFGYFTKLFTQLRNRDFGKVIMILSEDCAIEAISKIAFDAGIQMVMEEKTKTLWEWNFLFDLKKVN